MDHINHYSFFHNQVKESSFFFFDTHSAGKINLIHKFIASLKEVK